MNRVHHGTWFGCVLVVLACLGVETASATLVGTSVGVSVTGFTQDGVLNINVGGMGDFSTSANVTVGPGAEFNLGTEPGLIAVLDLHTVDIGDDGIFFSGGATRGYGDDATVTFTGLDWDGAGFLQSVDLEFPNGVPGQPPAIVGFTPGDTSVTIDLSNINTIGTPQSSFRVVWTTAHNAAVPEPITVTLGLMGLGALGMATRRRTA